MSTPPAARVMRLAIKILGGDAGLAREAALAYGLAGLLRSLAFHNARHKLYMPLDLLGAVGLTPEVFFVLKHDPRVDAVAHQLALRARDHFLAARKGPRPRAALPALLPAALVPVYLQRLGRDVPIHRRQMALLARGDEEAPLAVPRRRSIFGCLLFAQPAAPRSLKRALAHRLLAVLAFDLLGRGSGGNRPKFTFIG